MAKRREHVARRDVGGSDLNDVAPATSVNTSTELPRSALRRALPKSRKKVKVLFLSANTELGNLLALDKEYRAIEQSLLSGRYRNRFQLIAKLAVRRRDLQQALLEHTPHIVHFAGHGNAHGELVLLDDGPGSVPMSPVALASLFSVLRDNLELVVFNACFASAQAAALRDIIGITIGMHAPIEDRTAIAFASGLYLALAYGRSVGEAYALGVAEVTAVNEAEKHAPEIFTSSQGADAVRLVGPRVPPIVFFVIGISCVLAVGSWFVITGEVEQPKAAPPSYPSRRTTPDNMVRIAPARIFPGALDDSGLHFCKSPSTDDCVNTAYSESDVMHVPAFNLDAREVSNEQFAAWLNANASMWQVFSDGKIKDRQTKLVLADASEACFRRLEESTDGRVEVSPGKQHSPAVCVTWYGADAYCQAQGKRLPSATEWELAVREPRGRFPWGPKSFPLALSKKDSQLEATFSRQGASPLGVIDLTGNVAEWTASDLDTSNSRVIRGGGWVSADRCQLPGLKCSRAPSDTVAVDVGFRCAESERSR